MVLRAILRYLINNEKLIERMAESYPIRRTAQLVVALTYRLKRIAKDQDRQDKGVNRFKSIIKYFKGRFQNKIKNDKQKKKQ
ncbi:protein NCBP2AS2 homolog [Teleopsis dalmanni]|uniref:protein NCBP2AS2 homolog n=1 Tax=Teleopsis dalmanni TaxID=139649 RepID=UPI0018CEEA07|nr:protein NCBP2AS2 homolog [Teleopsis dalmanni]